MASLHSFSNLTRFGLRAMLLLSPLLTTAALTLPGWAQDSTVETDPEFERVACEVMVAGGGLGGVAAAYDSLRLGKQVCMTEITDWIGGQVTAQGVSALDERPLQRENDIFPSGYSEMRQRIIAAYGGDPNPGRCWVSVLCFSPAVGHQVLNDMLAPYVESGQLQIFLDTVVSGVERQDNQILAVQAIQSLPRRPELAGGQRGDLSTFFLDRYDPAPSDDWDKVLIQFEAPPERANESVPWMVIDATETGELWPLANVPYRLGTDPPNRWEPRAREEVSPYCTQGFTYTFVMERTATPQVPIKPDFYDDPDHGAYYSYEQERFTFPLIFTYRRIKGAIWGSGEEAISPGDQSMQNWTWGNDWRISTPDRNFILTQEQLEADGQLEPGQWQGGLRPEVFAAGERHAEGFFYWLVAGTTDFLLQQEDPDFSKDYYFRHRLMRGADTPMGTASGLSRYPYIRESRRLVGRPSISYPEGFSLYETDITKQASDLDRGRPYLFYDSVGVGQYPIDFHDCVQPDFSEDPSSHRDAEFPSYPFQVPLRSLIPQEVDNLLAGAKNIAASHIASAAYRVHPVEWAIGAAAGHTAAFALDQGMFPADVIQDRPSEQGPLRQLQAQIEAMGNPTAFPGATIFATEWAEPQ